MIPIISKSLNVRMPYSDFASSEIAQSFTNWIERTSFAFSLFVTPDAFITSPFFQ